MVIKREITLKNDFFRDKKGIHIKLDRDIHAALRTLSFQKGISMQEIFEEFALQLSSGSARAIGIIDSMILRRLNLPKRTSGYKRKKAAELSDPDKQALYDLIDGELSKEINLENDR